MLSILFPVAVILTGVEISRRIRGVFFHPLSAVPGPWYAAFSYMWLKTHFLRYKQTDIIHELLQPYGLVVRIGPNKIAFCDPDVMGDVYLVQKLTFLNNASQSARKKAFGPHYIATNVSRLQPNIKTFTLEHVESLESMAGVQSADCHHLLRNFAVDIIVSSTFGYTLGAVKKWTMKIPDDLTVAISDFPKRGLRSAIGRGVDLAGRICASSGNSASRELRFEVKYRSATVLLGVVLTVVLNARRGLRYGLRKKYNFYAAESGLWHAWGGRPPTYTALRQWEAALLQHNLLLPFQQGRRGGWNNCFNESAWLGELKSAWLGELKSAWLGELKSALRKDGWTTVATSRELVLDAEQKDVSMAVDMEIARRAAVFCREWVVLLHVFQRLVDERDPITIRFS
ncbi:hypothetical protein C8R44DRAFT_916760 [Mycena epipterygia]|nr:hypothetical protein C8R44DRAFT_916760 [Mycena epipterygia]